MEQRQPAAPVLPDQVESRAGYRLIDSEAKGQIPGEGGLAGSQISGERQNGARLEGFRRFQGKGPDFLFILQ